MHIGKGQLFQVNSPDGRAGFGPMTAYPVIFEGNPDTSCWEIEVSTESFSGNSVIVRATIQNKSNVPLRIKAIRWTCAHSVKPGFTLRLPSKSHPRYYCNENYRGDYFAGGTTMGDSFSCPMGNQTIETGWSEDSLFPGIFFFCVDEQLGLFCSQATQTRFNSIHRLRGKGINRDAWFFEIDEIPCGVPYVEILPGCSIQGEEIFFQAKSSNDPQCASADLFVYLKSKGRTGRQSVNPLQLQRIYCSWNFDFFADIDEQKMLEQIPIIKEHFPTVRFLQIDDGYQRRFHPGTDNDEHAMIDFCYKQEEPFDRLRFPEGPKAFCDKVKARGMRPAIWLGLWAHLSSLMMKEHPDWILLDETGNQYVFPHLFGGTAVLDPSVPEVMDYLNSMAAMVFGEWGFEGVKLDFSTFAFNSKRARYRFPGSTGVELRHKLEGIFRKHLPEDGFFGWCVVSGTSQIFLSNADYFRCALDIGEGSWNLVKTIALMCVNTNLLLNDRFCLPNIDSVGWSDKLDEPAWNAWLNLCAVTGMALEIAGDLRKLPDWRLTKMSRTIAFSNPLRHLRFLDLEPAYAATPPSVMYAEDPGDESLLALFNWNENEEALIDLSGYPVIASGEWRDAWNGEPAQTIQSSPVRLKPRESKMFINHK